VARVPDGGAPAGEKVVLERKDNGEHKPREYDYGNDDSVFVMEVFPSGLNTCLPHTLF
jgi:hypothetical protein